MPERAPFLGPCLETQRLCHRSELPMVETQGHRVPEVAPSQVGDQSGEEGRQRCGAS